MTFFLRFNRKKAHKPDAARVLRCFMKVLERRVVRITPALHGGAPFAGAAHREKA